MPFCIIKFIFYENAFKYSAREFSLMNKGYIYMVFNSIFLPGFTYTISLRFVQLLAFPRFALADTAGLLYQQVSDDV